MASALEALRLEAEGASPSVDGWILQQGIDLGLVEMVSGGRLVGALRLLLGDQWDRFKKKNNKKKDLEAFLEKVWDAFGTSWDLLGPAMSLLQEDKYCRLLEIDLLQQGVELKGLFTGELSLRRLAILVDTLGDRSLVHLEMGGEEARWDRKEYMMADIADMLNFQTILLHVQAQMAGLKKPLKSPKPVYARPGMEKKVKQFSQTSDLKWLIGKANG